MEVGHPTYELGFLILAAYMFNDPTEFKAISRKAILQLTPKFSAEWEKEELCSTLPLCVIGKLQGNSIYCDVTELSRVNSWANSADLGRVRN
jgi:hypothetical protein